MEKVKDMNKGVDITNSNVWEFKVTGAWNIAGSMKSEGKSNESKNFTLKVKFNSVPVSDIITKALEPTKIAWTNGQGRKNFGSYKNAQVIEIDFKAPARAPQTDPMTQLVSDAVAAGVDVSDRKALVEYLISRM
jgi:hypothetical protein